MASLKTLVVALAGLGTLSTQAYSQSYSPNQVGMAMMRLNASLLHQEKPKTFGNSSLWAAMRKDFRMDEVNPELVRRHESRFATNSAYFNRTIERSKPYLYHITQEVEKRKMPAEIALLPFIESAFVTKAKSHVGASGLWQFMPATGRQYGLEQSPSYDGRHDVYAATDAALNYLEYLHGMFGDWSLALAAYNWGEGNVSRAVRRTQAQGLPPTYENLRMPNETRNYVPKLLAVRNLVNNPETFGMNLSNIDNKPFFKTINLDQPIDVSAAVRLANISEQEFLALNPAVSAPVFIPQSGRRLLLPVDSVNTFERNLRNAQPETLLSWDIYTSDYNTSLSSIAAETGMSLSELKNLNGIRSNNLSAGRSILVAKNSFNGSNKANTNFAQNNITTTADAFIVQAAAPSAKPQPNNIQMAATQPLTAADTAVAPKLTMPQPVAADFIATRNVAANTITEEKAEPVIAISEPLPLPTRVAAAPAADTPVALTEATPAADTLVALTEAVPAPAQAVAISKPLPLPTQIATAQPEPEAPALADNQSSPLSTQIAAAEDLLNSDFAHDNDELALLAQESTTRMNAADVVRNTLAQADAEDAQAAKLASARIKQQQRIEARNSRLAQQVAAAQSSTHRVGEGDTLYNIAQRYNLSVADLITANNLSGSNIRRGQVLKVASAQPSAQNNIRNVSYTVRQGDTLNTIASRFNVDVNDIRRWNRNTRTIQPGQKIKLIGS